MKKTYINPSVLVVTIQPRQLLTLSIEIGDGTMDGSNAVARESNYDWEDDEEDY